MKIKLWDYDNQWGNIQGVICPKYSFFWAVLSAIYYFLIHPNILKSLFWLSNHLAFSFVMGFFYGVFVLDFWYSMNITSRIKQFAVENDIVVRYEMLKESIREKNEEQKEKRKFIFAFRSETIPFAESLKNYFEKEEGILAEAKKNIQDKIKKTVEKADKK